MEEASATRRRELGYLKVAEMDDRELMEERGTEMVAVMAIAAAISNAGG